MDPIRISLLALIGAWFGWTLIISIPVYFATQRDIWIRNPVAFILSWPFVLHHGEDWEVRWFKKVISTDKDNESCWPGDEVCPQIHYFFLTAAAGITKIGIGFAIMAIWQFEPLILIPLGLYLAFLLFVRGIWPTIGPHLGNKK